MQSGLIFLRIVYRWRTGRRKRFDMTGAATDRTSTLQRRRCVHRTANGTSTVPCGSFEGGRVGSSAHHELPSDWSEIGRPRWSAQRRRSGWCCAAGLWWMQVLGWHSCIGRCTVTVTKQYYYWSWEPKSTKCKNLNFEKTKVFKSACYEKSMSNIQLYWLCLSLKK